MTKILTAVLITLLSGCANYSLDEREIPLSKVPEEIMEAAQSAVPGFVATEAEIEHIVELEGVAGDKLYEIEVRDDGEILTVEEKKD